MVEELAKKYKKSPAQLSLRFLVQQGLMCIPGSLNAEQQLENINVSITTLLKIYITRFFIAGFVTLSPSPDGKGESKVIESACLSVYNWKIYTSFWVIMSHKVELTCGLVLLNDDLDPELDCKYRIVWGFFRFYSNTVDQGFCVLRFCWLGGLFWVCASSKYFFLNQTDVK